MCGCMCLIARAVCGRAGPGHVQVAAPLLGHALRQRRQLGRRAAAQPLACADALCLIPSPLLYSNREEGAERSSGPGRLLVTVTSI